jgi:hypothetical protein
MNALLLLAGRLAAVLGGVASVVAVLLRLAGQYHVVGTVSAGALLQGGMAALLIACVCLLLVLVARNP